ncbi:MAG: HD domain-containing protein [Candidatus Odinarchaeia archaeon]
MALFDLINFNQKIREHCLKVNKIAVKIANKLLQKGVFVNIQLVDAGSLLHDIGRIFVHDITHGVIGGRIIERLGYHAAIKRIAETHVLGGFTKDEAIQLGLPPREYLPKTLEEKICCYADKLCYGSKLVSLDFRFKKWREKYGDSELFRKAYQRIKNIEETLFLYLNEKS